MSIKILSGLKIVFGIFLIFVLILILNPLKILSTISSIQLIYLIPAVFLYALTLGILAYRWQKILEDMNIQVSLRQAYFAFVGGLLISDITPGRIGEISRPFLLSKTPHENKSILSVILDRSMDFATIAILGTFGILFIIPGDKGKFIWALAVPVIVIILIIAMWYSHRPFKRIVAFFRIPTLMNLIDITVDAVNGLKTPKITVLRSILITLLAWGGHTLRFLIIATSLGYSGNMLQLFFILPLISILSIVPITISGLGLVEGMLALVLSDMGIPLYVGLTIALVDRGITVAIHVLVGLPALKKKIM